MLTEVKRDDLGARHDTRSPQPTYTLAQVSHTHTHTHIRIPPPTARNTRLKICKIFILTPGRHTRHSQRWGANPFLDDQKRLHVQAEGNDAAREAAAREPFVLMVRRSQPADPARARLFRASIRFPTRSRLLSLCAHFPCATMSARAGYVERRNGLSTLRRKTL